jgi:hypothetical protein
LQLASQEDPKNPITKHKITKRAVKRMVGSKNEGLSRNDRFSTSEPYIGSTMEDFGSARDQAEVPASEPPGTTADENMHGLSRQLGCTTETPNGSAFGHMLNLIKQLDPEISPKNQVLGHS